jgi:hypothetical protein
VLDVAPRVVLFVPLDEIEVRHRTHPSDWPSSVELYANDTRERILSQKNRRADRPDR